MISLNSQPDQNRTSLPEKLFSHKLRTILPSLVPSTESATTKKHTITNSVNSNQNLMNTHPNLMIDNQHEKPTLEDV